MIQNSEFKPWCARRRPEQLVIAAAVYGFLGNPP